MLKPEELIVILETEDECPASGASDTPIKTPPRPQRGPSPTYGPPQHVKEEEDDIPPCPDVAVREDNNAKRIQFDMRPFWGMISEVVSKVPHNISGLEFYIIDVPQEDALYTKYKGWRYFEMHSSSREGFKGVRRLGKCTSSFIYNNKSWPLFLETGRENQHQFTTIGKNKFCYSCNSIVCRKPCSAIKLVEFNMQERLVEVYHKGKLTCQVKPNTEEPDQVIEENISRFGVNVGPKDLAQMKMTEEMKKQLDSQEFYVDKIVEIVATMLTRRGFKTSMEKSSKN